jgi:RimJ/RimL family protein N-acetyltransferase
MSETNDAKKDNFYLNEANDEAVSHCWQILSKNLSILPATWPKHSTFFESWLLEKSEENSTSRYLIKNNEDQIVGIISTDLVDKKSKTKYLLAKTGEVNISYVTFPQYAKQGIATFAVTQITKLLIENEYTPILRIAIWNKASAKVANKCGYEKSESCVVIQDFFDSEPTILDVYRLPN